MMAERNLLIFIFVIAISMPSTTPSDCKRTLRSDSDFKKCDVGVNMLSQNISQDDYMTTICSPYAKEKMRCYFQYIKACPELMVTENGSDSGKRKRVIMHFDSLDQLCTVIKEFNVKVQETSLTSSIIFMYLLTSPSSQKKMECFFQYVKDCPEVLTLMVGGGDDEWFYNAQTCSTMVPTSVPICGADRDRYGTPWNRTSGPLRVHRKHACPPDHTGIVYRQCAEDGIWLAPVYNCTADTLISIKKMAQNESSVRFALESLVSFTATKNASSPKNLVGNVQTASDILSLVVYGMNSSEPVEEDVIEDILDVANNLMNVNANTAWGSIITETGSGVDKVLTSIDRLVEKAVKAGNHSGKNAEFAKSNLYVTLGWSQEAVREISFPDRTSNKLPEWAKRSLNSIVFPMDNRTENVSYSSIIYKDLRGMIPGLSNESESGEEELNSPVISLTLFKEDRFPLKKPATITFQLLDRGLNTPRCSYWNEGLTRWDTDGCVLASYDARIGVVVCECSHLTNFAVLMSHAAATDAHMKILSVISIVGCGTSMICLVLTFAFYLYHWKRVGSERAILLLHLCVVLFVAYLVFLTGVDRVANKDACTSVAVTLHFLYLSVFFIMLAKSVYVTKMLLLPMNRAPITKWCLLAAYGSAAVVVAVSMGITKLHGYGTDTTCWLSIHSGLLWAFVGPALFVMAANAMVVVIVLKIKLSTGAMAKKTNQEKISDGLRTILVLLPIMGLTWVFGVFSVNEDTVVFQYIFAVCNSLQGLLIFIFHCLLDHKMKQQLDKSARNTKRKAQPHALANMKAVSGTNTSQEVNLSSPSTSTRDAP